MDNSTLFVKGKGPILTEYLRTRKKLNDAVAGRGFTFEPGFMYDAQSDLEIDLKSQLSELNYKLLEQAITQDLKQAGLDYDLAFKNAAIAWESEKQELVAAWDRELALAKQARAEKEESLNILAIEVGKRAIDLMEAKTEIELEAEGYRLQMEQLDDQTAEYEVLLANAKLATAEKKLEVIPYLQQIIDIESEIVGVEQQIAGKEALFPAKIQTLVEKETELVGKEQELANKEQEIISEEAVLLGKQQELLAEQTLVVDAQTELLAAEEEAMNLRESLVRPALVLLIAKMEEYVAELAVQLAIQEDIADAKTETIGVKEEIVAKQTELVEKRRLLSEASVVLISMTEELVAYKTEYLGGALSALIAVLEQYGGSSSGGGDGSIFGGGGSVGGELERQIELKNQIAGIRKDIEMLVSDQVAGELDVDAAEVLYEQQKNLLAQAEIAIRSLRAQNELLRAQQAITDTTDYITQWSSTTGEIISEKQNTSNTVINYAESEAEQKQATDLAAKQTVSDADLAAIEERTDAEVNHIDELADIQIQAQNITATLKHLLKQD